MTREMPPADADILCEGCGYRLNGLTNEGNCPECGKPIRESTTASARVDPIWETGGSLFKTAMQVLAHPGNFFRKISLHEDASDSRKAACAVLAMCAIVNISTIVLHYMVSVVLVVPPEWVKLLWFTAFGWVFICFALWWGILELTAWLTTLEGTFWGMRLPRLIVRRVLHYWTFHILAASFFLMSVPTMYLIIVLIHRDAGLYMLEYLYVLCGVVVVIAIYLFRTYWMAMKSIMFGNARQNAPVT